MIQTFSGGASLNLGNTNFGPYFVQNVSGATQGILAPPDVLDTNTLVINAAAGTTIPLHIFVTAQNVNVDPNVNPQSITSSFDNVGLAAGWNAIEQTYVDPNNGVLFGETMVFGQFFGPSTGFDETTVVPTNGSSVMSFTAQYTINPNGLGGQSNLGVNISDVSAVSVPGPVVGAGIPGLLGMLGFGGFGWWRRRRKIA